MWPRQAWLQHDNRKWHDNRMTTGSGMMAQPEKVVVGLATHGITNNVLVKKVM